VLYFKVFQLTGLRNAEMEGYVKALEEKNLAIHLANPTAPFDEDERKNLLEMIAALQRYESDQINRRKN
jgi:16S rRNA G527 N7-methylase RsmG